MPAEPAAWIADWQVRKKKKRKEKKYTIRGKKTVLDLNKHRFHTYRLKDYNTNTLKAIQIPVEYFIQ